MGLRILAHRGAWQKPADQNHPTALIKALEGGFGIETDLRDRLGQIVIAHDMADSGSPSFAECWEAWKTLASPERPFALNIKADGLAKALAPLVAGNNGLFFFDMSVPDMCHYIKLGLPVFTRHSDAETHPSYYSEAAGVWMDELESEWITAENIMFHVKHSKQVALVSGELHKRDRARIWELARQFRHDSRIMVCTDHPAELKEFLQ